MPDQTLRLDTEFVRDDESEDRRLLYKKVRKELTDLGIVGAPQPVDKQGRPWRPELINVRLSELSPDDTRDLLGQYAAWLEFVERKVREFKLQHVAAERRLRDIRSQIRLKKSGSATDKSDATHVDPRFKKADDDEYEAMCRFEMAEATLNGGVRSFFTVSRNITAQGQEMDRTSREHNVAPKRKGERGVPPKA